MILDYLRYSNDGSIRIPPFHTGHLGFIPETQVYVGLNSPPGRREGHCELFVTPFEPNLETLAKLSCTMTDMPGVVNRLVESLLELEVNIVSKESSGINYLDHHVVEIVLDWRTSSYREFIPTPTNLIDYYNSLQNRIPIMDYRYILLYEAIMSRCGSMVRFDSDCGVPLPAISIVPFLGGRWNRPEQATIEPADAANQVKFQLPRGCRSQILRLTRHDEEPLPYIISSEANSRTLRAFFPHKEIVNKILHVAFVHFDTPGALSAITGALAASEFNILTGLLRKKTPDTCGYEVLLVPCQSWNDG